MLLRSFFFVLLVTHFQQIIKLSLLKVETKKLFESLSMFRVWLLMFFFFLYLPCLFQDTGAVPVLNGSCGGLSLWSDYNHNAASPLYRRNALWPFSIFYSNVYRMTLPNWSQRAKVMLSLVEFTEAVYETSGIR